MSPRNTVLHLINEFCTMVFQPFLPPTLVIPLNNSTGNLLPRYEACYLLCGAIAPTCKHHQPLLWDCWIRGLENRLFGTEILIASYIVQDQRSSRSRRRSASCWRRWKTGSAHQGVGSAFKGWTGNGCQDSGLVFSRQVPPFIVLSNHTLLRAVPKVAI